MNAFSIKTEVFEGPLDLLLELVTKRKLFISDVSLAAVADDFIRYVEEHQELPLGEAAEFILIASTLMLIKSRSLLPGLPVSAEEEANIHDLRERLALYAKTKELAAHVRQLFGRKIIYSALPSKRQEAVFAPDAQTSVAGLHQAIRGLLVALPKKNFLAKVEVAKIASLEETIEQLIARVSERARMGFKEFAGFGDRRSIIVGFLAMLELVKRGMIRASQDSRGEIEIERQTA